MHRSGAFECTRCKAFTCPECGATRKNSQGMGAHRASQHEVRAGTRVVLETVNEALDDFSDTKKTPPTITELNKAFAHLATTGSVAFASYLAETDEGLKTDDEIDEMIAAVALDRQDAETITFPVARVIGRSRINKKAGRAIVDNVEMGEAAAVLVTWLIRTRRYMRQRAVNNKHAKPVAARSRPAPMQAVPHVPEEEGMVVGLNGHDSDLERRAGVLATPEMVDRIARGDYG